MEDSAHNSEQEKESRIGFGPNFYSKRSPFAQSLVAAIPGKLQLDGVPVAEKAGPKPSRRGGFNLNWLHLPLGPESDAISIFNSTEHTSGGPSIFVYIVDCCVWV